MHVLFNFEFAKSVIELIAVFRKEIRFFLIYYNGQARD
jgi:hypothetical protein